MTYSTASDGETRGSLGVEELVFMVEFIADQIDSLLICALKYLLRN
jgi:hypothetical protein